MIVWREEMSIGIAALDNDHRRLISIVNDFQACQTMQNAELTCKKLYTYAKNHFAREEQIQEDLGYSMHQAHKFEHAKILEKLRSIIRTAFLNNAQTPDPERVIASLSDLLHDWIVNHVMHRDMDMRTMVRNRQSAQHPADSLLPASAHRYDGVRGQEIRRVV